MHRTTTATRIICPFTLILAVMLVLACDRDSTVRAGDLTTTFDTVNGVIRVTNTGTPPEWRLTQVVSIGPKSLTETGNQDFHDFIAETPGAECDPRGPTRANAKAFIEEIYIAPDGKLWVEVIRTAGNRWELFDAEGQMLGTFPVRPRKEWAAPAFGPDHLVTIRQDSLDLDHVDVWRIDRGRQ